MPKVIGWDGRSRAVVRAKDDCGCEWTPDRKVRTETCRSHFRAACQSTAR